MGLSRLCGVRYQIQGLENIPKVHTPLIVLGKHQSAWETIAYPAILPNELCFVFKRELLFLPFFGWALGSLGMIHINRGDREKARKAVAVQGKQCLAQGKWITMFPEGTRTPRGSVKSYRRGELDWPSALARTYCRLLRILVFCGPGIHL